MADNTVAIDVEVKVGDLEARLDKIEGKLGDISDEGKKVGKQVSGGFKSAGEMAKTMPGPIGAAANAMSSLRAFTTKFVASLKTVKAAIASTGIGALVLAVGALVTYFANTERGAQKLRVIMAAVGATFAVVTDRIVQIVDGFRLLFSGEFSKGFATIGDAFVGIGEEIQKDVNAATALAEAFNKLKVSQRELGVESAKRRADIKELNKLAEDVTKSFAVRAKAAQDAADIEDELLQKRLRNAEENVRIIREQNALGESTEEDLQKLAEAEIQLANIRMESMELQTTIQNKLNTIRLQEQALALAARKAAEEEAKAAAERELDLLQQNQDAKIALIQNEEFRRIQEVELSLERKLAEITEESLQATELKKNLRLLADAEIIGIQEEGRQREIDMLEAAAAKKKAIEDKEVADVKAAEAAKQQLRMASFDAASGLTSALGQLVSASGEQSKGAVALQKTIAVATIAIDTAKAVVGAIAQAQSVPYPGNLVAMATGVAAVVAGIASAVTTLNSTPMPGPSAAPPPSANAAMASASAPSINQVNTNSTDLGNAQAAQLAPIQAFVVETEMTGNQNNINQIENQVTFGIDG